MSKQPGNRFAEIRLSSSLLKMTLEPNRTEIEPPDAKVENLSNLQYLGRYF